MVRRHPGGGPPGGGSPRARSRAGFLILVPDASAVVEVLRLTPTGRVLAPRLLAAELVAPELLDIEVASTLRRAFLKGEDPTLIVKALEELERWPIKRVSHRGLVPPSVRWWNNVSAYDAMYLATALVHEATVVTVDGPLSRAPINDVLVENVHVAT